MTRGCALVLALSCACATPRAHPRRHHRHHPRAPVAAVVVAAPRDLDSHAILERPPGPGPVEVRHILLAWADLAPVYRGQLDPRAQARDNAAAAAQASVIRDELIAHPLRLDALTAQWSEDPSWTDGGGSYTVTPHSSYVPEFTALALRLTVGEIGIVRSDYGYHVMIRVR